MERKVEITIENQERNFVITISKNDDGFIGYYKQEEQKYPNKIYRENISIPELFKIIKNEINQKYGKIVSANEIFLHPMPLNIVDKLLN